jgi:hypothetical protein
MPNGKTDVVIDYALPLIKIERLTKDVHALCLEQEYDLANEKTADLITEVRILQASLAIMAAQSK